MKLKMGLEYSDKISCFELENVFQMPLKHFLWTLRTCSEYLKGPPDLYCCPSKKKRDHMTHQSDYMLGKVKKVEIFKK